MAKKKSINTILNIVAVAGAAGGAYLLYKKYIKKKAPADEFKAATDKIKAEQASAEAIKNQTNATNAAQESTNNIANPHSFKGKVAIIQRILGVAFDGKPGAQTNAAYKKRFGLDRGPIDAYNLDYYLRIATTKGKDPFFMYG
jgi:hypothetical protein